MTMDSAVVALAFTPDGVFLAGATSRHILIWRVEDVTFPRARWVRDAEPGWESPRTNGSSQEEDQHCLCWDAEGQKLAYAVNSQVGLAH
jgi:transducin (beta)-like 1